MQLTQDNNRFAIAARELTVRFVRNVATIMHEAPEIAFDVTHPEAVKSDLLFNMCFLGIAQFEELSGIDVSGMNHTPRVAFDTNRNSPSNTVLIGDTQLHGLVGNSTLAEGVERARERVTDKAEDEG